MNSTSTNQVNSRPSLSQLRILAPGAAFIPVKEGKKTPLLSGWQNLTSTWSGEPKNEAVLEQFNVGVNLGSPSGGICSIDLDSNELFESFTKLNPWTSLTLVTRRKRGGNIWLRMPHPWPAYCVLNDHSEKGCGEFRSDGHQTVIAGAAEGVNYTNNGTPVADIEFIQINWPPEIAHIPLDPIRQVVEAEQGEIFTWTNHRRRDGSEAESLSTHESPLAHYLTQRLQILHDGILREFYMYDSKAGIWRLTTAHRVKEATDQLIKKLFDREGAAATDLLRKNSTLNNLAERIRGVAERNDAFRRRPETERMIHAANGMLLVDASGCHDLRPFSPDYMSRNACPLPYDPTAACPRFIKELLTPMLPDQADRDLLQRYCGACLLGGNASQMLMILSGRGDDGKGVMTRILMSIVGAENASQLRTDKLHDRFEIGQYENKTLLIGSDVESNFLDSQGASVIKSMVGGDPLKCEKKGANSTKDLKGNWNILVATNNRLRVKLDNDLKAWRRRLMILEASESDKDRAVIANFDDVLLKAEGAGIFAWMVEGAAKHLAELDQFGRFQLTEKQREYVERLLAESDAARHFVRDRVAPAVDCNVMAFEILEEFGKYCDEKGWSRSNDKSAQTKLTAAMLEIYHAAQRHDLPSSSGKKRGWKGYQIIQVGDL